MSHQKTGVNLYSTSALKDTSDEHVPTVLKEKGYERDFKYDNVKLAVGYASVIVAAICGYCDYYIGFDKMFVPIAICVAVYTVLSGFYTLWTWKIERGLVFSGKKGNTKITIRTRAPKHTPNFTVDIELTDTNGKPLSTRNATGQFNSWFDYRGFIDYPKFKAFIEDVIPSDAKKSE